LYAFGLKKLENYTEAAEAFKNLGIEIGSPYEYRREIAACTQAAQWLADTAYSAFTVQNSAFNSLFADYSPALYANGTLVVTSDRSTALGKDIYNWTGNKFADLYTVDPNVSGSLKPFEAASSINSKFNEGTATFNTALNEIFFTRCGGDDAEISYCKIFSSKKIGDSWTIPEMLPFVKEKINYGTPTISPDGNTLYFSSNDPEGWGGFDIYVCPRSKEGLFDEPKVLPRTVNSTGNELYPTLDGDTLYFSSDYFAGLGGLDIFKSYKQRDGSWSSPRNMLPPINSGADDFTFVVEKSSNGGYFTSSRIGGKGNDDIYRFQRRTPKEKPIPPKPKLDTPKAVVYQLILDGVVLEKIYEQADNPNSRVIGRKPLAESSVDVLMPNGKTQRISTNAEGAFSMRLDENADYLYKGSHVGYLNNETKFSTKGIGRDAANPIQKFEIEIVLDKIFKNKEIVLENIYYDYDKSDIRPDAQPTLNRLAEILNRNPQIKIQLSSHTDCRGNDDYNLKLSQRRADAAVAYLISQSIAPERLTAKGYGESAPADPCECKKCTEDQYQANRRTTFKVLE
jgi:peptidoglycan-associated lipoprotein